MHKYEIWYQPRIDDPIAMWGFETLEQAKEQMAYVKQENPKAYPHHYIWDVENKVEVDLIKETLQQIHWEEVSR